MAKQATLKELVLGAVEGFLATNTPFSVYNITQSIRQVVNSGAVEVPALKVFGQPFSFSITHEDVKHYFNELYEGSAFSQSLVRNSNGRYFEYQGLGTASPALTMLGNALVARRNASVIAVPSTSALGKNLNFANNSPSAAGAVLQATAGKLGRSEVIDRVRMYLQNCSRRGVTPTNRQIQSAIKRNGKSTGWGRSELDQIRVGINNGTI
jgi:hypothetical protein